MIARHFLPALCGSFTAIWLVVVAPAQEVDELNALMPESLAAMKAERWEEALKLLAKATSLKPATALRTYGPQFGVVWYRRGVCEMKLHRWDDALHSFETCYCDYPNRGPSGGNLYQTKALLKWGEAAVGAKKWDVAILRFRKFLEERDKVHDQFSQGTFYVTLGICHYKLAHIPEGNEQLEIAIRNRESFPTSDDQIIAGVQALVQAAVSSSDEPALLDFLSNNEAALAFDPRRALPFAAVYLKLASDAAGAKMDSAALLLYRLVVDPAEAIPALKQLVSTAQGAAKATLEADLRKLEADHGSEAPIGLLKLLGLASVHEHMGDNQAACELRERIYREFPEASGSGDNLRQLGQLRLRMAHTLDIGGKRDEAITAYGEIPPEAQIASATRRFMELLWDRNQEGDRLKACRVGHAFLDAGKESVTELSDEDQQARDEIAKLTKAYQAQLMPKTTPPLR